MYHRKHHKILTPANISPDLQGIKINNKTHHTHPYDQYVRASQTNSKPTYDNPMKPHAEYCSTKTKFQIIIQLAWN